MLSARSFSAAALCGASVRSASAARATPQQQHHRRQRLAAVDAPLSLSLSSSIGLPRRQRRRPCRSSPCRAVSASAAQSTELPPELKRIVTAFSMVRSPRLLVERTSGNLLGWNSSLAVQTTPLLTTTFLLTTTLLLTTTEKKKKKKKKKKKLQLGPRPQTQIRPTPRLRQETRPFTSWSSHGGQQGPRVRLPGLGGPSLGQGDRAPHVAR